MKRNLKCEANEANDEKWYKYFNMDSNKGKVLLISSFAVLLNSFLALGKAYMTKDLLILFSVPMIAAAGLIFSKYCEELKCGEKIFENRRTVKFVIAIAIVMNIGNNGFSEFNKMISAMKTLALGTFVASAIFTVLYAYLAFKLIYKERCE